MGVEVPEPNIVDDSIINKCVPIYTYLHIELHTFGPVHSLDVVGDVVFFYHIQSGQFLDGEQIVEIVGEVLLPLIDSLLGFVSGPEHLAAGELGKCNMQL